MTSLFAKRAKPCFPEPVEGSYALVPRVPNAVLSIAPLDSFLQPGISVMADCRLLGEGSSGLSPWACPLPVMSPLGLLDGILVPFVENPKDQILKLVQRVCSSLPSDDGNRLTGKVSI